MTAAFEKCTSKAMQRYAVYVTLDGHWKPVVERVWEGDDSFPRAALRTTVRVVQFRFGIKLRATFFRVPARELSQ